MADKTSTEQTDWLTRSNKAYILKILVAIFAGLAIAMVLRSADKDIESMLCGIFYAWCLMLFPLGLFAGLGHVVGKDSFPIVYETSDNHQYDSMKDYQFGVEIYSREAIPGLFAAGSTSFILTIYNNISNLPVAATLGVIGILPFILAGLATINAKDPEGINGRLGLIVIFELIFFLNSFDQTIVMLLNELISILNIIF